MIKLTPEKPPYYENIAKPKLYVAMLTQSSTNAPIATEVYNDTGATITFDRTGAGQYRMFASTSIFTNNKTYPESPNKTSGVQVKVSYSSGTQINITTEFAGTPTDGMMTGQPIRITVYQ